MTANTAASARIAPAMNARIKVSRVDMNIFDSPASTILVTNSAGARYDIVIFPLVVSLDPLPDEFDLRPELGRGARRRQRALLVVRVLEQQVEALVLGG